MVRRINYQNIVGSRTFIGRYMASQRDLEMPYAYDFWSAMWLISVVAGRTVTIPRPRIPVYMNWFILFISESGVTRKSTAVNNATKIARAAIKELDDHVELIECKTTPETLEWRLQKLSMEHQQAYAAISIKELVNFLGKERYTQQMPGLLTDLYDSPELRAGGGTLLRGPMLLRNVFVSFLAASTPSWLLRNINPDVIEGGFTSRCLFIYTERRKQKVAWPKEVDPVTVELEKRKLVAQLQRIALDARKRQRVEMSDGGLSALKSWYKSKPEHRDPFRASFETREDDHVLRMAGCLAINDHTWEITEEHVRASIRLINEVKEDGARIFAGGLVSDERLRGIDRVRRELVNAAPGVVSQSDLLKSVKNFIKSRELRIILEVMHELGMVTRFSLPGKPGNRPTTAWRATNIIADDDAIANIIDGMEPDR